jgi:hypothetical protein
VQVFATSPNPILCARVLDDKRVVKMVLESAQMLSTVRYLRGDPHPYRPTHENHPLVKWVAADPRNEHWLLRHFVALSAEYTHRYCRTHLSAEKFDVVKAIDTDLSDLMPLPLGFCNCSGVELDDVHEAYKQCLINKWKNDKRPPQWTNREAPSWNGLT